MSVTITSDYMSLKIFAVLALLVLVMSPMAMAQYGYLPPSSGGQNEKHLEIELESTCEGNTVTIYHKNTPSTITGAQVTVTDVAGGTIFSGDTNGDGQITFEGCGMTVRIYASKAGYIADEETHDLVACEQCEEEETPTTPTTGGEEPDGGETGDEGTTEFECTVNTDCLDTEYCNTATGAAGGECEPVVGECGYAENHAWVTYECGSEAGCPSCDSGFECSDHTCVPVEEDEPVDGGAAPGDDGTETGDGEETGEGGEEEGFPLWMLFIGGVVLVGIAALIYWLLMGQGAARGRR